MAIETESSRKAATKARPARADKTVRIAVAGATGYAGREVVSLLVRHPLARIVHLASSGRSGKGSSPIEHSHPALRGRSSVPCQPLGLEDLAASGAELAFLATPHETSLEFAPALLDRGLRVIDLSGAFRLRDRSAYPRWYGFEHHAAEALGETVYGLPELNRDLIRKARLVSNPGCYATSAILALRPLVEAGWIDLKAGIVCDSKSGASGAGRAPSEKLHFPEVNENCRAYSLFNHRHAPEILQALEIKEEDFTFTPHLLPITRGILSTVYVHLARLATLDVIISLFREFYANAPMVRVYGDGTLPEIQGVAHSNYVDLGFALDHAQGGTRLVVVSALDNLGKGAAGQAVQNMNLMYGFREELALQ
jgi:N-acetyl-gamma-glutamyl-phosphate reductase